MIDQIFVLTNVLAPILTGKKAGFDHPEMDSEKIPKDLDPVAAVMALYNLKPAARAKRALIVTDATGKRTMRP